MIEYDLSKKSKYDTKEKIIEWAKSKNINLEKEIFDQVDIRSFKDIIPTIDKTFEKYPFINELKWTDEITKKTEKGVFSIKSLKNSESFMNANGGIQLGKDFKDYKEALKTSYNMMLEGFTVSGNGKIDTLISHELGHRMQTYIEIVKNNSNVEKNIMLNKELHELFSLKLKGHSEYSSSKLNELFAEGFAEYMNGDSEFGIEFGKLLERWLK